MEQHVNKPDGNCSSKVGELPKRVRGMNKVLSSFNRRNRVKAENAVFALFSTRLAHFGESLS